MLDKEKLYDYVTFLEYGIKMKSFMKNLNGDLKLRGEHYKYAHMDGYYVVGRNDNNGGAGGSGAGNGGDYTMYYIANTNNNSGYKKPKRNSISISYRLKMRF